MPLAGVAMITKRKILLFILLTWIASDKVEAFGGDPHPVQARLLADVAAVAPGEPFRLGVELRMAEGWHTYWAFSGDAGMPTQVEWDLPEGFEAGVLQWPLPGRYEEAGGLTAYGYADEVLLLVEIVPTGELAAEQPVRIGARVSWLVCREVCIPGDASLALELPAARGAAGPANEEIFGRYRTLVPGPLRDDDPVALDYAARRAGEDIQVDLTLTGRRSELQIGDGLPDFYPLEAEDFEFASSLVEGSKPPRLKLELRPYGDRDIEVLKGVVVYRLEGEAERRGSAVELSLEAGTGGLLAMDFREAAGRKQRSLAAYLLLAAVGGLILNLMPCVLPVISLKVLSFVSQAGEERGRIRQLGLAFAAGIAATFLVLAAGVVVIKGGGEQLGWGFQFQYPGFVMAMTGLVFALGLSLFGVFTFNLPGSWGSLGGLTEGEGLAGSFFNGVLATILATPCTAPFLGTALGFAFSQEAGVIWGVFAAIGLGMALPYVALALQPGWMRFLPRPGIWMEHFKQLMGFLLMGTVLWLLWVLGKQVGLEGVIWTGAFLLCLALACWLVGQWVDLRSSGRKRRAAWILALVIVGGGFEAFLGPVLEAEKVLKGAPEPEGELAWQPFSAERVEDLIAQGRHVFIDFTAEWCWTCKVNEQTVLGSREVRDRFGAMNVALIRADWTRRDPEIARLLRAFGRSGVPLYVLFPAGRPDQPLVLPEVITTGLVLEKLDEAAALD